MREVLGKRTAELEPVVIIENPVSLLRSAGIPGLKQRAAPLLDNADTWRYRPLHLPERIVGLQHVIRYWNQRLLRSELDRLLPASLPRIVCYDSPSQYSLVGKLGEQVSIYLAIDDRTLTLGGNQIRGELGDEKKLLEKIDKIICVSESLANTLRQRLPQHRRIPLHVLSNGYDERLFDPSRNWPEPQCLSAIPKPRILVAGHISERIDWEGIEKAARARPEWAWFFIGPSDRGFAEKIGSLSKLLKEFNSRHPGIFCHPPVPVSEVPAVIAHCDVCAIPYRLNSFTLASSPLKGSECLAMGAPVLSTRIPSLMRFGEAIQWVEAGNGESYAGAIDRLASETNDLTAVNKRRAAVAGNTWAHLLAGFRSIAFAENE